MGGEQARGLSDSDTRNGRTRIENRKQKLRDQGIRKSTR